MRSLADARAAGLDDPPSSAEKRRPGVLDVSHRIEWVDHAKGIGIVFVVLGHVIGGLISSGVIGQSSGFQAFVDRLYTFHMPLFFLLAGLFVGRSARKDFSAYASDKISTIAYPYFVWSILQSAIQALSRSATNNQVGWLETVKIVYSPVMQFWFIYGYS